MTQALELLLSEERALELDTNVLVGRNWWQRTLEIMQRTLNDYHTHNPLRTGMPREELRNRLALDARLFAAAVATAEQLGEVVGDGAWLSLPTHEVVFSKQQQQQVNALLGQYSANSTAPPTLKDAGAQVGQDVLQVLMARGDLIAVSAEVAFDTANYRQMVDALRQRLKEDGSVTVAQSRDMFGTSRKYALALLEHLDQIGMTKRVGDERVLKGD